MKLLFTDKKEFEYFCDKGSTACPSELGFDELLTEKCEPHVTCQKCWEQSGAEIIFETDEKEKMKSSDILLSLDMEDLAVSKNNSGEINVYYKGAEIKDGMFLVSARGRGKDFEEACDDYLSQIRGKTLVFDACTKDRREITVLG